MESPRCKAMIIHHRAATRGNVSYDNAHPFEHDLSEKETSDGKARWLIGVHNGGVTFRREEDGRQFAVDSDHLFYRMTRDGAAKALSETYGDWALVWTDMLEKKIHIASNEERALHFAPVKGCNTILIASEAAMLYWLAKRNGLDLEAIYRPKKGMLYTFDPSGDVKKFTSDPLPQPVRKEEPVVKATSKSADSCKWDASRRCNVSETITYRFEDYYGPEKVNKIKGLAIGSEYWFEFKQAVQHQKDENKWDLYGNIITTDAEIVKAAIFNVSTTLKNNVRDSQDIYVKPIGVRDIVNKATGTVVPVVIMAPPIVIISDTAIDKAVSDLMDSVRGDEDFAGDRTVRGPGNKQIGIKQFNKLVKDGCSRCGDNLTVFEADQIGWVNGDSPVCEECIPLMTDAGYTVS
jgi:predicted glutamine amidotransferase